MSGVATSTVIINLAYVALLSSTFTRRILWLRTFLIVGAIGFITHGFITRNWSMVSWNLATSLLHSFQLTKYVLARRATALTHDDEEHRRRLFPDLDSFDFASLWSMGESVSYENEPVIVRDEAHGRMRVVLDGIVDVYRPDAEPVRLGPGSLVGEMTFVAGGTATAECRAVGTVTMREWPHERLATLDQLNPVAARALHAFLQRDLVAKLG